ncbi:MAG: GTPase HflX [Kiritimatiellia bacterium]
MLTETEKKKETALLVGVSIGQAREWEIRDSLEELARLAATDGVEVVHSIICRRPKPDPGYYIGRGKAEEIRSLAELHGASCIIFDEDLSPAQARNLEELIGLPVLDRTQIILDIFSMHADTHEGRLQVDLARLEYQLPRLRRMWTHLERQVGGIGVRGGPGEQQMEVDRRRIKLQIERLKDQLEDVRRHRAELRRGRRRHGWAAISIVGYTNAGKSTLLNALTGAEAVTNDQLFVTLDPTTRKVELPNQQMALLTDTVGFISKLPHHLVEAFKATLEEVNEADLLVHVIDASHPLAEQQIRVVNDVLEEMGAEGKPVVSVLNKIDCENGLAQGRRLSKLIPDSALVSARTGEGMEALRELLADTLRHRHTEMELCIPLDQTRLIAGLRANARIAGEKYEDDGFHVRAWIPERMIHLYRPYLKNPPPEKAPDGWSGNEEG